MSYNKGIHENFAKVPGKHLCQCLFFDKGPTLRVATLLKKRLYHWYFPVNFEKSSRIPFLHNTSGRLLLTQRVFTICKLQLTLVVYSGQELTYDLFFSFYVSFIFFCYFCFIFLLAYFIHFVFAFLIFSSCSFLNFSYSFIFI